MRQALKTNLRQGLLIGSVIVASSLALLGLLFAIEPPLPLEQYGTIDWARVIFG